MKKKFYLRTKLIIALLALGSSATISQMNRSYAYSSTLCKNLTPKAKSSQDVATEQAEKNFLKFQKDTSYNINIGEQTTEISDNINEINAIKSTSVTGSGGGHSLGDPMEIVIDQSGLKKALKMNDSVGKIHESEMVKEHNMMVNPAAPYGINGKDFSTDEIKQAKKNSKSYIPISTVNIDNTVTENEQYKKLVDNSAITTIFDDIKSVQKSDFEKNNVPISKEELDDMHYDRWVGANARKEGIETFCKSLINLIEKKIKNLNDSEKISLRKKYADKLVLVSVSLQTNSSEMSEEFFPRLMYNENDPSGNSKLYCETFLKYWLNFQNKDIREIAKNYGMMSPYDIHHYRRVPTTTNGEDFYEKHEEYRLMAHPVLHAVEFSNNPIRQGLMLDQRWHDLYSTAIIMAKHSIALAQKLTDKSLNFSNIALNTDFVDGKIILNVVANIDGDYLKNLNGASVVITNAYNKNKSKEYELNKKNNSIKDWETNVNLNEVNENIDFKNYKNNKFYFDFYGNFDKNKNKMFSNVASFEITPNVEIVAENGQWKEQAANDKNNNKNIDAPAVRINEVTALRVNDELKDKNSKNLLY